MSTTYIVSNWTEASEKLNELRKEWGGKWAFGTGNNYPEDYTVLNGYGGYDIRTGDKGGQKYLAHIRVNPWIEKNLLA